MWREVSILMVESAAMQRWCALECLLCKLTLAFFVTPGEDKSVAKKRVSAELPLAEK